MKRIIRYVIAVSVSAPALAQATIFLTQQPQQEGRAVSTGMFPARTVRQSDAVPVTPSTAAAAAQSAGEAPSVYPSMPVPGLNTSDMTRGAGESDDAYLNRMKGMSDRAASNLNRVSQESEARMRALAPPQ
ncbi:hypothetical protein [Paraburkholderia sediminicola]|uniref:hypothetical protein n=1 Tax=Paraburkholderia sediminicola TaxID=458836 RepID=UPI0038BA03EA